MKILLLTFFLFFFSNFNASSQCTPIPINDSPCMNNANPPYDLGFAGYHSGTTCCAIGYNDDANQDKANVNCSSTTDDDAVWYRANIDPSYDGVMISLYDESGTTIGYEHSVEIYAGTENAICDGTAEFIRSYCVGAYVSEEAIGCLHGYDYLFIKVSSSETDCGTFSIDLNRFKISKEEGANNCNDISEEKILYPQTYGNLELTCTSDYLSEGFCPNPGLNSCEVFETNPTIWYKIVADEDANELYVNIVADKQEWTPVWSVFSGDCPDLEVLEDINGNTCIQDSDPASSAKWYNVHKGDYYIAVSSLNNEVKYKKFDLCVRTIKKLVPCIGNEEFCENDENTVFEIINRDNIELEPSGPPFSGPFCPGENLTLKVEFIYNTSQTNDEGLLAMIPDFGKGWDVNYFNPDESPPVANINNEAEWYEENNSRCYAYVTENLDNLCTYTDDDSNLHIVNVSCSDYPCIGGMKVGDPLPSGYFWAYNDDNDECNSSDCSPSTKRGIRSDNGEIKVSWIIKLKVKEKDIKSDDLSISFLTFSDGVAGCHNDQEAECLLDIPQFSPKWKIRQQPKNPIVASKYSLGVCSKDTVGISLLIPGDTTKTIVVSYIDNPNVIGEKRDTFTKGKGLINDTLKLANPEICDSQIVYYFADIIDSDTICLLKKDTIKVIIYPKPVVTIKKSDESANNAQDGTAEALVLCTIDDYSYLWSTGDTTKSINNLSPGLYTVTVTGSSGCAVVQSININSYVCDDMQLFTQITNISCYDDCTGKISIDSVSNGIKPYNYLWNTGDSTSVIKDLCKGTYFVTITDAAECSSFDTFSINSPNQLISNITAVNETSKNANDGIAQINPKGGVMPYDILWSTGDTSSMIDGLAPGKYYVTISDENGCTVIDSTVINKFECNVLGINAQTKRVTCYGDCDGIIIVDNVINRTGPITFEWSNGNTTGYLESLCADEYSVTVTDSLGCIAVDTFTIEEPDEIIINIDSTNNITDDEQGNVFVSTNNTGNYKYKWAGPNDFTSKSKNLENIDIAGCYTLLVTDTITNCSRDTTICIEKTTGFVELANTNQINLYPNPASKSFYLSFKGYNDEKAEVGLYSVSGKKVQTVNIYISNKPNHVSIRDVNKGLYFVKIKLKNQIVIRKLLIGI